MKIASNNKKIVSLVSMSMLRAIFARKISIYGRCHLSASTSFPNLGNESRQRIGRLASALKQNPDYVVKKGAEDIAQALWYLNRGRKYGAVVAAYESLVSRKPTLMLPAVADAKINHAAMLAYGEIYRSSKAREIMQQLPPEDVSFLTMGLLMNAYVVSDQLRGAERLLQSWFDQYPPEPLLSNLITNGSEKTSSSDSRNAMNHSNKQLEDTVAGNNKGKVPLLRSMTPTTSSSSGGGGAHTAEQQLYLPLAIWLSVVQLYGRRRAWQQCIDILLYLENMRDEKGFYVVTNDNSIMANKFISDHMDEVTFPTFLGINVLPCTTPSLEGWTTNTSLFLAPTEIDAAIQQQRAPDVDATVDSIVGPQVLALQWSAIYHTVLRVLVECKQFTEMYKLLQRMQSTESQPGEQGQQQHEQQQQQRRRRRSNIMPVELQLSGVISLVVALRSPGSLSIPPVPSDDNNSKADNVTVEDDTNNNAYHNDNNNDSDTSNTTNAGGASKSYFNQAQWQQLEHQRAALALREDVTTMIFSLATPTTFTPAATGATGATAAGSGARVDRSVRTLAREYLMLLCELNLMHEADALVDDLLDPSNFSAAAVTAYAGHDTTSSSRNSSIGNTIDNNEDDTDDGTSYLGESSKQRHNRTHNNKTINKHSTSWLEPYLKKLRENGQWERSHELYVQYVLVQAQAEIPYSSPTSAVEVGKSSSSSRSSGSRSRSSSSSNSSSNSSSTREMPTPSYHSLSNSQQMMYHDTCRALLEAGKLEELADFLISHSEDPNRFEIDS